VKALLYYNIVHNRGWDVPGASPEEIIEYLRAHPEEDKVYFLLQDLWYNLEGKEFTSHSRHFTHFWIPREIEKEQFKTEYKDGVKYYTASRLAILTDPVKFPQYAFVRDFRQMLSTGGIKVAYTDELTYLFECDYPAYLQNHPGVDLETLGLK
ncbi:MAG: hypothetical protein ABIC40_07875, partial [bacterium]